MGENERTDLMEASKDLVDTLENISSEKIKEKAEYKNFTEALSEINKISSELMKKDETLEYPVISKEQKKNLIAAYTKCSKAIKSLKKELQNNKDNSSKAIFSISDSVMSLLSKDVVTLNAYDPDKEEKTLPKLIKDARLYTFDVTGVDISRVGGNLSSRIPLSYTKPDGTVVKGMFTLKRVLDGSKAVEPVIKDIIEDKSPENIKHREFIIDYFNAVKQRYPNMKNKDIMSRLFYKGFVKENNRYEYSFSRLQKELFREVKKYRENNFTLGTGRPESEMAKNIADEFENDFENKGTFKRVLDNIGFAKSEYEIEDSGRVDSRNSAMSTVAELLGVGNVIAKSVPAYIKNGDQKVEGTFMEYVDGVDVNNMTDDERKMNSSIFNYSNGLKSVADLQILDFICGNVDRHLGNIICLIDKETKKFKGVKGIDNDASMGCYVPEYDNIGRNRLAPLDSIKVISESMAASVMALDDEVLQLALREYDLKPTEINACCERLNLMKKRIDLVLHPEKHKNSNYKPDLQIIKDEDFKLHKAEEFSDNFDIDTKKPHSEPNMFGKIGHFFNKKMINNMPAYKKIELAEVYDKDVRISVTSVKKNVEKSIEMVNLLNSKTEAKRTSANYKALQEACEEYKAFVGYLSDKKEILDDKNIKKMNDYLEDLEKAADKYLKGKGKLTGRKEYTQNRIDAALKVKEFAQSSKISKLNKKEEELKKDTQENKEKVARKNRRI